MSAFAKARWAMCPLMAAIALGCAGGGNAFAKAERERHVASPTVLAKLRSGPATSDAPSSWASKRSPISAEPFGLFTFPAPEGLLWVKWRRVQQQIRGEANILDKCRADTQACSSAGAKTLLAIIAGAQARTGRARIEIVNRLVNLSIRYVSDYAQHGVPDLWSPPLATLTAGRGDCEDYAIAKYVALREAGTAPDDLRLLLVRDRAAGQVHAVLAARHDDRWLILDNRHMAMHQATDVPQLTPLFVLDHGGVKLFAARRPQAIEPPVDAVTPAEEPVPASTAMAAAPAILAQH